MLHLALLSIVPAGSPCEGRIWRDRQAGLPGGGTGNPSPYL